MRRSGRLVLPALLLVLLVARSAGAATAQRESFFVDTTRDIMPQDEHCTASEPCPLRAAVKKADEVGGIVRACYDPAEVAGGRPCPDGARPLRKSDPGFDAASGKWVIQMIGNLIEPQLTRGGVAIDFARDIETWDGPEDNRIVISSAGGQNFGLTVQSDGNLLTGFDVRGVYEIAALELRVGASDNQLGPGLVVAGVQKGAGIRMRDGETSGNRVVGSWCGVTGDGSQLDPVEGDCLVIHKGAHDNAVGGAEPSDRNVLAASSRGAALAIDDADGFGTRDNVVRGNWIGLDAQGEPVGSEVGILISEQAHRTEVLDNVVSGNRGAGISLSGLTFGTYIHDNVIGAGPQLEGGRGNGTYGIQVWGSVKDTLIEHNRVTGNRSGGVLISGANTRTVKVTENSITANGGPALVVSGGANESLAPPVLDAVAPTEIMGRACPGCVVEIFSDPAGEAAVYEGRAHTDVAFGLFLFDKPAGFSHTAITAVAIDANGNSSGLSEPRYLPGHEPPTPNPSPTPSGLYHRAWLPWLCNKARLQ